MTAALIIGSGSVIVMGNIVGLVVFSKRAWRVKVVKNNRLNKITKIKSK